MSSKLAVKADKIYYIKHITSVSDHYWLYEDKEKYKEYVKSIESHMLQKAVSDGLFDFDSKVEITFKKLEYDILQKQEALNWLKLRYKSLGKLEMIPTVWALHKYNELRPFNMLLIITKEEEIEWQVENHLTS